MTEIERERADLGLEPGCGGGKGDRETDIERGRESQPRVCRPVEGGKGHRDRERERAYLGFGPRFGGEKGEREIVIKREKEKERAYLGFGAR